LQYYNSASLDNLEVVAPITATSTTVTINNSADSQVSTIKNEFVSKNTIDVSLLQLDQQTDDKSEAQSTEETDKSDR